MYQVLKKTRQKKNRIQIKQISESISLPRRKFMNVGKTQISIAYVETPHNGTAI